MWTATLALNGLIGAGVPQDWATHMIGHELTALHNIDHARTLAIVLPAMLNERRVQKKDKLLQYGERVWGIRSGSQDERIKAAIEQTRDFFERMGIATRLGAYGLGKEAIDVVVRQLEAHGMTKLSEHGDVTPQVSRRVLEAADNKKRWPIPPTSSLITWPPPPPPPPRPPPPSRITPRTPPRMVMRQSSPGPQFSVARSGLLIGLNVGLVQKPRNNHVTQPFCRTYPGDWLFRDDGLKSLSPPPPQALNKVTRLVIRSLLNMWFIHLKVLIHTGGIQSVSLGPG